MFLKPHKDNEKIGTPEKLTNNLKNLITKGNRLHQNYVEFRILKTNCKFKELRERVESVASFCKCMHNQKHYKFCFENAKQAYSFSVYSEV